jgi:hypothetical protein
LKSHGRFTPEANSAKAYSGLEMAPSGAVPEKRTMRLSLWLTGNLR